MQSLFGEELHYFYSYILNGPAAKVSRILLDRKSINVREDNYYCWGIFMAALGAHNSLP